MHTNLKIKGIFISSINTNSGKTWFTCQLIQCLSKQDWGFNSVKAIKPIQSGFENKTDKNSDSSLLLQSQKNIKLEDVCLFSFKQAIAPNKAAKLNNVSYDLDDLTQFCNKQMTEHFCLVEGAGGLFSPISDDALNWQLAQALKIPVVIIVDDILGSISGAISAYYASVLKKIDILCFVVNRHQANSHRQTKQEIKKWVNEKPVLSISENANAQEFNQLTEQIKKHLAI